MNKRFQKILSALKNPPEFALVMLYIFTAMACAGAIVLAFYSTRSTLLEVLSYLLYGVAALLLGYSVYTIVVIAPKIKNKIIIALKKREITRKFLEQYGYRTAIISFVALMVNVIYVAFNGVLAVAMRSVWYGALAGYHLLLIGTRAMVLLYHRKRRNTLKKSERQGDCLSLEELKKEELKREEIKKYRTCGILLITMPICLSFAILQMVVSGTAFVYWDWTVFAFAAYAFYKITIAIINVVKARAENDFSVQALINVNLADGMVSILALQTSLLFAFGEGGNYGTINAITGGVVCALTILIGILMIARANVNLKKLK